MADIMDVDQIEEWFQPFQGFPEKPEKNFTVTPERTRGLRVVLESDQQECPFCHEWMEVLRTLGKPEPDYICCNPACPGNR
jgi:hypothetical protein